MSTSSETPYSKAHFEFDSLRGVTTPWRDLKLSGVALGLIRLQRGTGYTFTHRHERQEEVYIVVEGAGTLLVGGESLGVSRGDIIRVAPETPRALCASKESEIFVICCGGVAAGFPRDANARYLIDDGIPDYDDVPPWYAGDEAVARKNAELKARMQAARARRSE